MATSIALGMRLSTATELANAAGIEGEISVVESEWRAVVHDGTTKGGHPVAKKSEVDAVQNTLNQIPNTYLTKTDAQNTYLGKTAKAASATTADSATTAGSATKATQDANGNVINTTYATVASVNTVAEAATTAQTAANNAQTTANNALPKGGGTLTGGVGHTIVAISATSGTVSLTANRVHKMTISGSTTFSLPTVSNTGIFTQIKVIAKVTGTPTINWGTTNFFNKKAPTIEAGNYDFYFDYDPNLSAWVLGALSKGAA